MTQAAPVTHILPDARSYQSRGHGTLHSINKDAEGALSHDCGQGRRLQQIAGAEWRRAIMLFTSFALQQG
jgi:hypothetical protein